MDATSHNPGMISSRKTQNSGEIGEPGDLKTMRQFLLQPWESEGQPESSLELILHCQGTARLRKIPACSRSPAPTRDRRLKTVKNQRQNQILYSWRKAGTPNSALKAKNSPLTWSTRFDLEFLIVPLSGVQKLELN